MLPFLMLVNQFIRVVASLSQFDRSSAPLEKLMLIDVVQII